MFLSKGAIGEMDQRVCTETNNMSDMKAGSKIREQRIKALKQELETMQYLEMKSPEQKEAEQVSRGTI